MPAPGGGFEQSCNAQAAVDTDTMLVLANELTQAANDKQQLVPMLQTLSELPEDFGQVEQRLGDAGDFSATNVNACIDAAIERLLARGRECSRECSDAPGGARAPAAFSHEDCVFMLPGETRCSRMRAVSADSVMAAMTRTWPPQRGQRSHGDIDANNPAIRVAARQNVLNRRRCIHRRDVLAS